MIDKSAMPSSYPPGARASARTSPVTLRQVSCVRRAKWSHVPGATALLTSTVCRMPVPSRITMKATLPEDRRCVTQPRTVTAVPAWLESSLILTECIDIRVCEGRKPEAGSRKWPGASGFGLPASGSLAFVAHLVDRPTHVIRDLQRPTGALAESGRAGQGPILPRAA